MHFLCSMDTLILDEASRHGMQMTEVDGTRSVVGNLQGVIYEITLKQKAFSVRSFFFLFENHFGRDGIWLKIMDLICLSFQFKAGWHKFYWKISANEELEKVNLLLPTIPCRSSLFFLSSVLVSAQMGDYKYINQHKFLKISQNLDQFFRVYPLQTISLVDQRQ